MEYLIDVLPDPPTLYDSWRRIVFDAKVLGKQVHDARIVAFMSGHGITHLVTLNPRDFSRYAGISVVHPSQLITPPPITPASP